MIGRPIAMNEPKVSSRTIIAASRPIAVAGPSDGFSACSIAWPPSATCSEPVRARLCAVEITVLIAATGSERACSSKVTVANATVCSGEI